LSMGSNTALTRKRIERLPGTEIPKFFLDCRCPWIHQNPEKCRVIANDLFSRKQFLGEIDRSNRFRPKQGIAINQDGQGLPEKNYTRKPQSNRDSISNYCAWQNTRTGIACLALLDLLKRIPPDYWQNAYACEAVARIGSPDAIPILRKCLKSARFTRYPESISWH